MKAVVHCSKVRRMDEAELKVGGRVVILSEGKEVSDGRLEALDGVRLVQVKWLLVGRPIINLTSQYLISLTYLISLRINYDPQKFVLGHLFISLRLINRIF